MNIFGIGPLEIVFIILLAIIIFGPKDIANTSKTIGRSLNKLVRSDTWRTITQTSRELKNLPNRLMRESGLDKLEEMTQEQIRQVDEAIKSPGATIVTSNVPPGALPPQKGNTEGGKKD